MHNRREATMFPQNGHPHEEMSRRIAGCRERLRRDRAARRISRLTPAPDEERATGEGCDAPALEAFAEETEREH